MVANKVTAEKSKGSSDESKKPLSTSDNSLKPVTGYVDNVKTGIKFDGDCLKQDKVTFSTKAVLDFCIVYE